MFNFFKKKKDLSLDTQKNSRVGVTIEMSPIKSVEELDEVFKHAMSPNNLIYKTYNVPMKTRCEFCDGHYVFRQGKFGNFFGCSNFPKCKNTKSFKTLSYLILKRNGVNIYEMERVCWKCNKKIKVHSYFPQIDFILADSEFAQLHDFKDIRLSVFDSLDNYMSEKYDEIMIKYSKTIQCEYMANTCPHCNSLQGLHFLDAETYKDLLQKLMSDEIEQHIVENVKINDSLLSFKEWEQVVDELIGY